jgi:hypothetical protein
MKCKLKLELAKILTLEFELSAGKDKKEETVDEKKESPAPAAAPSK